MSIGDEQIQQVLLNQFRRQRTRVSFVLLNGERLDGTIDSFDLYSIRINCPEPRLIVKTTIAMVQPATKKPSAKVRAAYVATPAPVTPVTPATAPIIQRKKRRLVSDKT
jgi:RNA chaperone Hfq